MNPSAVADAMSDVTAEAERHTWRTDRTGKVRTVVEGQYLEFGLRPYYRDERLAGIVIDALC